MPIPRDKSDWLLTDSPEILEFLDKSDFPWDIRLVYEIDSTQSAICELPAEQRTNGLVLAADVQSAGRGRSGRTWEAESGDGLLMSFVIPTPAVPAPILAALAVMYVLQPANPDFSLKWPNDIVVDKPAGHEKVGGIIATAFSDHVVIGIGLNLRLDAHSRPVENARGLEDYGVRFNRDALMLLILDAVQTLQKFPVETLLNMYRSSCSTLNKQVRVHTIDGNAIVGKASKISVDGALVLEIDGNEFSFNAVDVEYLR